MMIGPMKKKVITSAVVTAIVLILIFAVVSYAFISQNNKRIAELEKKSEVVQRYIFVKDLTAGDVVTASDVMLVDVKGESAASDSYVSASNLIGRTLKVNANAKTIVTESLFFEEDKLPNDDMRLQELNMVTLPSDLEVGDYIDIRLRFPTGEDYLVLAGKKVISFGALEEQSNTIFLKLDEEEIVKISSAIIESYIRDGIKLYANKYVDPDAQLFTYDRVDFVEKYENAEFEIISGDSNETSGENLLFTEEKRARTLEEISAIIGLNIEETENIKIALAENDIETLEYYEDKLVVGEKALIENYPVKLEVAALIQKNPNIIQEIKNKYNVEALEQERIHFLDTGLYLYERDINGDLLLDAEGNPILKRDEDGTPKYNDNYLESISGKIEQEITTQKTERQEYLLDLLARQSATQTAN